MFAETQFQTLFAYHWHVNGRLLACARQLPSTDYHTHPGYGHHSVHGLFIHIIRAMHAWDVALKTGQQPPLLDPETMPDLTAVEAAFAEAKKEWDIFVGALTSEAIEGNISVTTLQGYTIAVPLWRVLQHMVLHGMQHHTELAQLLTAKGQSPGDIDFIFFTG